MLSTIQDTPLVFVAESQFDRLFGLASASHGPGAALLRAELDRAIVLKDEEAPQAFVRLGSRVRYRDLISGREWDVTLTPPEEASMDHGRLSVLTPAGAALVGLTPGARFEWIDTNRKTHALQVLEVGR